MSLPCGFVTGIIHHPNRRGLVYARTDIGGAARLDLRTRRWVQLLHWIGWEEWNWTGVESLALDPSDPGRLYLAVGTYTNEWSPINGAILRSTDEGRTFRRTDLPFKLGGNEPGRSMGERLAVDPRDGRVLYLGTRNQGLWRSTDRGESWARVESFQATGTAGLGRRSPGPYEMYDGAVHKVDTATGEWTDITPLRPNTGGEAGFGYAGLALDPRKPGTVMVATMSRWGPVDDIFRSVDGGVSWHSIGARAPTAAPFSCLRQQICRVVRASWRQCSTGPGTVGLRRERPGSTGRPIAADLLAGQVDRGVLHRLVRQGRARAHRDGGLYLGQGRRYPWHLPLRRQRQELGEGERRPASVRLHGRGDRG